VSILKERGRELIVIPAIDIKNGCCVRLQQGRMSESTVFSDVPEEMALKWYEQGAKRLHLVDLDGAIQGKPINRTVVKRIVDAVPIPVQLGGGVRNSHTLETYFHLGVKYVILGTVTHKDPDFVKQACERFPGQILLGIDGLKNHVAVEGWTEKIALTPIELAKQFEMAGAQAIIYTDIHRDGMKTGPNVDATGALAEKIHIPVIASGGISSISDVIELMSIAEKGVMGMITGRALYDGSLNLGEAIRVAESREPG
jgi:phosphoribosylformimino-5-aminoimidazole carboxamide ribotide isomerase